MVKLLSRRIKAPFSPEQIQAINELQLGLTIADNFPPLVCPKREKRPHGNIGGRNGLLLATSSGMHCVFCGHVSSWVYDGMTNSHSFSSEEENRLSWVVPRMIDAVFDDLQTILLSLSPRNSEFFDLELNRRQMVICDALRCLHRRQLACFDIETRPGRPFSIGEPWIPIGDNTPGLHSNISALFRIPYGFGQNHPLHGESYIVAPTVWRGTASAITFDTLHTLGPVTHWRPRLHWQRRVEY